jgi:hypothetical protein
MAEVVGLVLGVLPLIITVVEDYEALYRPFSRYKKFEPLTKTVQNALLKEKTIFRNQCRLLLLGSLGAGVGGEEGRAQDIRHVQDMLADLHDFRWNDEDLGERVSRYLGDSRDVCVEVVKEIRDQLRVIDAKCRYFGIVVEGTPSPTEVSLTALLSLTGLELTKDQ